MAVPARKVSKTSGRMRRTHYKINAKTTTVCPKCGSYKGEEIIKKESKEENE